MSRRGKIKKRRQREREKECVRLKGKRDSRSVQSAATLITFLARRKLDSIAGIARKILKFI